MKPSKLKDRIKKFFRFLLNPKFLLCFGIGWLITNGWSYILMGIGTYFQIGWMAAVAFSKSTFMFSLPKPLTLSITAKFSSMFSFDDKIALYIAS